MVRWMSGLLMLTATLSACGDKEEPDEESDTSGSLFPTGEPVIDPWEYAGITGNRSWTYSRKDTAQMIVDDSGAQENGASTINTLTYVVDDAEQKLYFQHTIDWAAGPNIGIEIRGYDGVAYNNPVVLVGKTAFIGDTVTSVANGTFTSTLVGFEECPNSWTDKWTCLHVEVTGGAGEYFVGDWWFAPGWGPAIFQPEVEDYAWVLRNTNVIE